MNIPVLLPKVFNYPFTYKCTRSNDLKPGDFVEVPFGNKTEIGVVWDKSQNISGKFRVKFINKKIKGFVLSKNLIKFINWFSMYNITPRGLVLKMCIGNNENLLKKENVHKIEYNNKKKYFLNKEQNNSLNFLKKSGKKFNTTVLQGVTGSGKTLVYFERIKQVIKTNRQALILLPEIFLTNQFKERFQDFFGFEPAIWHSKITPKNKRKVWQGIIKNKINLVIGARSSLFLPFKNLGLIVVDEEHDQSYKQEEQTIYHARDMAITRASIENIPINLVTSIPSLETYNNIINKKYKHTVIKARFKDYPLPKTKIINLNLKKIKNNFIADETIEIVKDYLNSGNQILFFLNRRGYAPFVICKKCGYKHSCPNCSIYLTLHRISGKLICHHCAYERKIKRRCLDSKNDCDFSMFGPGVERVLEELKIKFPNKVVKIFSSDYLSKKKESEKMFEEIKKNKVHILVGTQMISKGFNFPKLNCIVVVDADFSGKGYDLRTTEKNIQLYNQLSGRAGRFSSKSIIVYQTLTPSNKTLDDLIINNPEHFLKNELVLRKKNNLPPFIRLIAIIVSSRLQVDSFRGAQEIKKMLMKLEGIEVLGPVDSPILKMKKKYRTRLLLRTKITDLYQKNISKILENLKISSKIKLTVDVDPINFG